LAGQHVHADGFDGAGHQTWSTESPMELVAHRSSLAQSRIPAGPEEEQQDDAGQESEHVREIRDLLRRL